MLDFIRRNSWSIPYVMVDPVHDLRDVITEIGRRNHYNGNTIVTFSLEDDTGRKIFLNRIEGKPLLFQELYDKDTAILTQLFAILTNSNEDIEFGDEPRISILYTRCPYEANIIVPRDLPNQGTPGVPKRKFPEFNRQFKNSK